MARPNRFALAVVLLLAGCAGVGPQRLDVDQMGYATALGEGLKRQMLLNMVRLRHADVPTFLSVTQVISGYTLQSTAQAGLNAYPNAAPGNFASASGTVQYTTRPTFTFTPLTGEQFAQSYLRPLAPAELLSLAQSGVPIELLFRLGVHSVNGLLNGAARAGDQAQPSEGFDALMQALGEIQASNAIGFRFERGSTAGRVYLLLDDAGPRTLAAARAARRLLGIRPAAREIEVVYGRNPDRSGQVAVLTRSVLQILYELGAQIDVPEVPRNRRETPAIAPAAADHQISIHQGERAPPDAFAAVEYRDRWFWIEGADHRSKATFTFAHILQVLAESSRRAPTPIITIPAQ